MTTCTPSFRTSLPPPLVAVIIILMAGLTGGILGWRLTRDEPLQVLALPAAFLLVSVVFALRQRYLRHVWCTFPAQIEPPVGDPYLVASLRIDEHETVRLALIEGYFRGLVTYTCHEAGNGADHARPSPRPGGQPA